MPTRYITLKGGPMAGNVLEWEGGDVIELLAECHPDNLTPELRSGQKALAGKHTYRRARFRRHVFTYQGVVA